MAVNPITFLAPLNGSLAYQDQAGGGTLTGSGAVRYQAASGARINKLRNPRFYGTPGAAPLHWGKNQGGETLSIETDQGYDYALKVTTSGADAWGVFTSFGGNSTALNGFGPTSIGTTWTFSVQAKVLSGTKSVRIQLTERDAAGGLLGISSSTIFTLNTTWQRISKTYTTINAGVHNLLYAVVANGAGDADFYIAQAFLEESASATPYFDGSTGGAWLDPVTGILGTAHASPSVSQAAGWVEEATTNQFPNPSAETNTTHFNFNASGTVVASDVTYAYIGSKAVKYTNDGTLTGQGFFGTAGNVIAAAQGQTWTFSCYARGSGTVVAKIREADAANATLVSGTGSPVTLTDQWQRIVFSYTTANVACAFVAPLLVTNSVQTVVFWIDAIQVEQKAYATSYCDGSLGTGYSWSGTAHASSSTRAATTEKVDETNRISPLQGALAVRFQRLIDTGAAQTLFDVGDGTAGTDRLTVRINAADKLEMGWTSNGAAETTIASAGSIAVNTWYWGYVEWSGTAVRLSLDNGADVIGTRNAPQGSLATANDLAIGLLNTGGGQADCAIGPLGIGARPLTAAERAKLAHLTQWDWRSLDSA